MDLIKYSTLILTIVLLSTSAVCTATEDDDLDEESYQSPFDKISDQNITEINNWLNIKTEVSLEKEKLTEDFANIPSFETNEPITLSLSIELEAELSENLLFTITAESERQHNDFHSKLDEAAISLELDTVTLSVGRLNLPVVQLNGYFITDPLIQFAETKADTLLAEFQLLDSLQINFMLIKSNTNEINQSDSPDYAFSLNWTTLNGRFQSGFGYLSDLSESDEKFLSDLANQYHDRVDALNVYLFYAWSDFEVYIESVKTLKAFKELENEFDQPVANNLEFTWFPAHNILLALRYETSDELEDSPETQHGITISYRPQEHVLVALDYLHGSYKSGFVEDDNDNELKTSDTLSAQLTVEF